MLRALQSRRLTQLLQLVACSAAAEQQLPHGEFLALLELRQWARPAHTVNEIGRIEPRLLAHDWSTPSMDLQRRGMFIQTQSTPNPSSMMFVPGKQVMESGTYEFSNARAGMCSPLATRLFSIDGVEAVFFGTEFITISKAEDQQWALLKPQIFAAIMDHFSSGDPMFKDAEALAHSDTAIHPDDDEVVAMIKELLETRIRPAVQDDGGDIVYKGFNQETGTVTLKMVGACSGCPSSSVTLKSGIENMLMHYIPEVKEVVEAEPDEGELEGLQEFEKLDSHIEAKEPASAPLGHLNKHLSS